MRINCLKPKVLILCALLSELASAESFASDAEASHPALGAVEESKFRLGGYMRGWASFNLQNPPETPQNDRGNLSMLRGSLLLDGDGQAGPFKLKAVGRFDREYKTSYLDRLESQVRSDTYGGPGSNLMNEYNQGELREAHVEFDAGDRFKIRLGKQQVVWGESDFFRAMDIVHGFDYRWRSFLEPENEELRKPLIMANVTTQVPEANGSLQIIVRPGLDRGQDIGNTYDLSGGRWALQPNKGVDFLSMMTYDYSHPSGNKKDVTGGFRWAGLAGPVNYSLAYLKTFSNDPVVNSRFAPYKKTPNGELGDFIYPEINLVGMTLSGYVPTIDAVLSTEMVYTRDQPFNIGTQFLDGALPGFGGILKKDTLRVMLRMDKTVNLQNVIGTSRPSFLSVQLFDTRVLNYKSSDDIVDLAGFGAPKKRDSAIITAVLGMNYWNDRINPSLAAGYDISYGGGFLIPSVEWVLGDQWRMRAEANLFFPAAEKLPGQVETDTHMIGWLSRNNQLLFRVTRQF